MIKPGVERSGTPGGGWTRNAAPPGLVAFWLTGNERQGRAPPAPSGAAAGGRTLRTLYEGRSFALRWGIWEQESENHFVPLCLPRRDGPGNIGIVMTKTEFARQLSDHLFWDVDRAGVDVEAHRRFLIPRVMDRGTLSDVKAAWEFYGEECVREVLLKAAALNRKTIAFFANQFNVPRERFRAFRDRTETWTQ